MDEPCVEESVTSLKTLKSPSNVAAKWSKHSASVNIDTKMSYPIIDRTSQTSICPTNKMSLNFLKESDSRGSLTSVKYDLPIETMSSAEQETLLTEEVLGILSGVESDVVKVVEVPPNGVYFVVDDRIQPSLRDLTMLIAQVATHYYHIARFVEKTSSHRIGKVNQALTAVIRRFQKDYLLQLSETEALMLKGDLTLQELWFIIHPNLQAMSMLSSIICTIERENLMGGKLLSLLHEKTVAMVGDAIGQKVCHELAMEASRPYFDILESWIHKGIIKDPYSEFFVSENRVLEVSLALKDNEWDAKYSMSPEKCPSFLHRVKDEIYKAGKYLNVIRQCGKKIGYIHLENSKIHYSIHERVYANFVEKAYDYASRTLLSLLLKEYDLMKRLASVKHYLLMDQGDFIVQLLDLTENELSKSVDDLNPVRLDSLLQLALRTSSSATDPYKDNVGVQLFSNGIEEQLTCILSILTPSESFSGLQDQDIKSTITGVEGFAFSYEASWPVSLILNSRFLVCYQMIFRHLFYCKHVERQLCKVWTYGKGDKGIDLKESSKAAIFSLKQDMLGFVQNLLYYTTFEVIEPSWHCFLTSMNKVCNVDEVIKHHEDFINSILSDSMLTNAMLFKSITSLLGMCLKFTEITLTPQNVSHHKKIIGLKKEFFKGLVDFLGEVANNVQNPNNQVQSSATKIGNIIHRINFNGFYSDALERLCASSSAHLKF